MILFLDTEFTDFAAPDLISIGLVAEDGREFYAERSDFDRANCSGFVKKAVLPRLAGTPDAVRTRDQLREDLASWLSQLRSATQTLVAFDYAGDWTLFCDALGGSAPAWLEPLPVGELLAENLPERLLEDHAAHNALEDARALRADWIDANRRGECQ